MKFNTALLHGAFSAEEKHGATLTPIYQSVAFEHDTAEKLEDIFAGHAPGFVYSRIGNPTVDALEKRMAFLEGGIGTVACASGMSAISAAVMNIVKSGDEILSGAGVFGGTIGLFHDLEAFGIHISYVSDTDPESYRKALRPNTKLIFVETIGNPKLDVPDLADLSAVAHENGIPLFVDNTAATPFLVQPLKLGADIVIHSTSKYISGSGHEIGGVIVDGGTFPWNGGKFPELKDYKKFGTLAHLAKLRAGIFRNLGGCLSPFHAFLNIIGLETLGLRMEKLSLNTAALAESLLRNPKIAAVNYPGLSESPWHQTAKRQFGSRYGAILTLRTGSKDKAFQLMNALKYASILANIGDVRTLVIHPASTIYRNNSEQEKESAGVYDDLIRVSVGLEDVEDLIEDFGQAAGQL